MNRRVQKRFVILRDFNFIPLGLISRVIHILQAAAFFERTPLDFCYALRNHDAGQASAAGKGNAIDHRHAFRYHYAGQAGAAIERAIPYFCQACRNRHIGQTAAQPEGLPSKSCHALRNGHAARQAAAEKRIVAYVGNAILDHQLCGRIGIPWSRRVPVPVVIRRILVIHHGADAGNGQRPVGVDIPCQVIAAAAEGDRIRELEMKRRLEKRAIIIPDLNRIPLRLRSRVVYILQAGAAGKRTASDAGHTARNRHTGQAAPVKGIVADAGHALGNLVRSGFSP